MQPSGVNAAGQAVYVNPQAQSKVNATLKVENGFFGQDIKRYDNLSQPIQGVSPVINASQKQQPIATSQGING